MKQLVETGMPRRDLLSYPFAKLRNVLSNLKSPHAPNTNSLSTLQLGRREFLAATGATFLVACNPFSQPPDEPPVVNTPVPGADRKEQEQDMPIEMQVFMQVFKQFRNSFAKETQVSLTFYPNGIDKTKVVSKSGAYKRTPYPSTTQSGIINGQVDWGKAIEEPDKPRFKITIIRPTDTSSSNRKEEWFGNDEWQRYSPNQQNRYAYIHFVAAQTPEDGVIVEYEEPPDAVTRNWPRTI